MTTVLRIVGPAMAMIGVVAMVIGYFGLPDIVPTHFGVTGEADAYGPRWNVLLFAGIWAGMQVLLGLLATKPRLFNYPVPVTSENAQRLYREGERMLVWLGVALAAIFAGIGLLIFGLPGNLLTALGGVATVVITIVGIVRLI